MIENKCKKCGALMEFDAKSNSTICKSCGNSIAVNLNKNLTAHDIDFNRLTGDISSYQQEIKASGLKCSNCGALVQQKFHTIADKCQYCGASVFVEDDGGVAPDGVVLFEIDKEEAIEKFKIGIRKKKFLPNAFKKNPPMDKVEALYFPAFTFSAFTQSHYIGRHKVCKFDDDYYYRSVSGTQDFVYSDVLVEGSRYLTQNEFIDVAPYDLGKLYAFNKSVIIGYSVEYYNRTIEEAGKLAKQIMQSRIRSSIERMYSEKVGEGIDNLDIKTNFEAGKYSYLLLPTYKVTYKYGKKEFSTFVNGQTGKVGGRVPRSKAKIFGLIAGILLGAGLIIGAIFEFSAIDYLLKFFK